MIATLLIIGAFLATFGPAEISLVAGASATVIGAYVTIRKLKPEREGVLISNEQGAALIYDNYTKTLQADIKQRQDTEVYLRAELERKDARINSLEAQVDAAREDARS